MTVHSIAAATTHHAVHGLGLLFVYLFLLGLLLILTAFGSLAARRRRGYDARSGQVRAGERLAKPQIRVGRALVVIGAVGFGIWWLALR